MNAANWKKGDRASVTTTTAGAEMLEIVSFVRRDNGRQFVRLASVETAANIRAGLTDAGTVILTGIGGRVREIETQRFHKLAAAGYIVKAR